MHGINRVHDTNDMLVSHFFLFHHLLLFLLSLFSHELANYDSASWYENNNNGARSGLLLIHGLVLSCSLGRAPRNVYTREEAESFVGSGMRVLIPYP